MCATKSYGMRIEYINMSNPAEMRPYVDAYNYEQRQIDSNNWSLGRYIEAAVLTAVDHNLNGFKAKSKYIQQPFGVDYWEENKKLTEEELQEQREQFVLGLEIRQKNFKLSHKRGNS